MLKICHQLFQTSIDYEENSRFPEDTRSSECTASKNLDEQIDCETRRSCPVDSLYPQDAPRVLFALRFKNDIWGEDLSVEIFRRWLRSVPAAVEEVRVEASFKCFSTLVLVSMPASMAAYMPQHSAIFPLGFVKSTISIPSHKVDQLLAREESGVTSSSSNTRSIEGKEDKSAATHEAGMLSLSKPGDSGAGASESFDGDISFGVSVDRNERKFLNTNRYGSASAASVASVASVKPTREVLDEASKPSIVDTSDHHPRLVSETIEAEAFPFVPTGGPNEKAVDAGKIPSITNIPAEHPHFACHFYKRDPIKYGPWHQKYTHCLTSHITELRRLKYHYKRAHTLSECNSCHRVFPNQTELRCHHQEDEPYIRSPSRVKEGIDNGQWEDIDRVLCKKGQRAESDFSKWYKIWRILFPAVKQPATPWIEPPRYVARPGEIEDTLRKFKELIEEDVRKGTLVQRDEHIHERYLQCFRKILLEGDAAPRLMEGSLPTTNQDLALNQNISPKIVSATSTTLIDTKASSTNRISEPENQDFSIQCSSPEVVLNQDTRKSPKSSEDSNSADCDPIMDFVGMKSYDTTHVSSSSSALKISDQVHEPGPYWIGPPARLSHGSVSSPRYTKKMLLTAQKSGKGKVLQTEDLVVDIRVFLLVGLQKVFGGDAEEGGWEDSEEEERKRW